MCSYLIISVNFCSFLLGTPDVFPEVESEGLCVGVEWWWWRRWCRTKPMASHMRLEPYHRTTSPGLVNYSFSLDRKR